MDSAVATPPAHSLILDEGVSPETQALAEALAADLSPMQHAVLQRLIDAAAHDIYHRADTDAEEIRAGFVAHLARGPEVIWAHVRHGDCPV